MSEEILSSLKGVDNHSLHAFTRGDAETARASIVLVHGLGEHSGRYEHVIDAFVERGFFVLAFDQRGHGKTEGKRGLVPSGVQMMFDIGSAIRRADSLCPERPLFLYGHSMGAGEVLYYGLNGSEKPDGILATSPPLKQSPGTARLRKLVAVMNKLFPGLTLKNGLDVAGLSRNPEVIKAYLADPLVHPYASVALASMIFDCSETVLAQADQWNIPLFLAHGSADPICLVEGSDDFVKRASANPAAQKLITYKRWEGLYHETHNEPEQAECIEAMCAWIEAQTDEWPR